MGDRIGLYGGSFNPIHHGHLIAARAAAEEAGLVRLIWLCSARPPHKDPSELVDAAHRSEMVRLAIHGERGFEVDDFDLTREGPTYTIDTVRYMRHRLGPRAEMFLIIGADSLAELTTWRDVPAIMHTCRVMTLARPEARRVNWAKMEAAVGAERAKLLKGGVVSTPMIDISSTDIRRRVYEGRSIRYLVPESVAEYIAKNGLYRQAPSDKDSHPRH